VLPAPFPLLGFHGANTHPRPKCYEIATNLLQL